MGFFDTLVFTTLLSFLSSLCTQLLHIAIVVNNGTIKLYSDPREGARVMGETVPRRTGERETLVKISMKKFDFSFFPPENKRRNCPKLTKCHSNLELSDY